MSLKCAIVDCCRDAYARELCAMHYARVWRAGLEHRNPRHCEVAGCEAKHKGHGLCQKHLRRQKQGHSLTGALRTVDPHRYVYVRMPDHPLAMRNGRLAKHRQALYDAVDGCSPLPCFWCAIPLSWELLVVDHLDHNRRNNEITNLVPACNSCNCGRTRPGQRSPMYQAAA